MAGVECRFENLSIDLVEHDPDQPRKDFGTEGDKNRLLNSIKSYGINVPLSVHEVEPNRYILLDGHRRYNCAIKLELKTLPCMIFPKLPEAEFEARRFEIQNNRRSWKPTERSEALQRLKYMKGFQTNRELAEYMGLSETALNATMSLAKIKSEYQSMIDRYQLSDSFIQEFLRLKSKLRKISNYQVSDIIPIVFDKIQSGVIKNAKDLRTLGRVFLRATANSEQLIAFLEDSDMTVRELEQRTLVSGFSLHVEELIKTITTKRMHGIEFSMQEKEFLDQLRTLLNAES